MQMTVWTNKTGDAILRGVSDRPLIVRCRRRDAEPVVWRSANDWAVRVYRPDGRSLSFRRVPLTVLTEEELRRDSLAEKGWRCL